MWRSTPISFKPFQNASSRLTLVLCPATTIERLSTADCIVTHSYSQELRNIGTGNSCPIVTNLRPSQTPAAVPGRSRQRVAQDQVFDARAVRGGRLGSRGVCRHPENYVS